MDNLRDRVTPPAEIEALRRELAEARRQQAAAAEVLRIVSRSAADAAPVFDAVLDACLRLFSPYGAAIYLVDGDTVKGAARRGFSDGDWGTDATPLAGSSTGRAIAERRPVHIVDLAEVADLPEDKRAAVRAHGGLTTLYAPMISGERGVGSLVVARRPKQAFTQDEIASLSAFADQAVIAIENARLFRETQEALAQQTATADVLKAINRSAFDPQSVLEALINSAVSLSGSTNGVIWRYEDGLMHACAVAQGERRDDFIAHLRAHPQAPGRGTMVARVALTGQLQHIPDAQADPDFPQELRRAMQTRATLGVPMTRGDDLLGAIVMSKPEAGTYPERIVELVKTFADQAVIAIENSRLFEEVQARTRELSEALVYQTGGANILRVIASSPTDVAPVLQAIVDSACEVCGADDASVLLRDGDAVRRGAHRGPVPIDIERWPLTRASVTGRAILDQTPIHVPDIWIAGEEFAEGLTLARRHGSRTILAVPLLRDGESVGAIVVRRNQKRAFADKQIEILRSFADQAAIALGNVRLFDEVQAKTRDLEESLSQQTATADVLKTISRSVFDLDAVLQTLIDTAVRLARGSRGTIFIRDGDVLRARAFHSQVPPSLKEYLLTQAIPLSESEPIAVAVREGRLIHVPDMSVYDTERVRETQSRAGFGAALWVPLMRDGEAIGLFGVPREEAVAFSEREIELVRTFADQAVIAIENARLFSEVQARTQDLSESLEYQTAISNVLGVISHSPNEVQPVLDTIVATARVLCVAERAVVWRVEDGQFRPVAFSGMDSSSIGKIAHHRLPTGSGSVAGQAAAKGQAVQILDATLDPSVGERQHELARAGNIRTILAAPLMNDGVATGCLTLSRTVAQRFDDRQVGLLQTFAEQAVIAINNVRLFEEVQARTRDVEESLAQQTATAEVLKVISRSVFDLQTVFETLLTTAVNLVGAVGGALALREGEQLRFRAGATPQGRITTDFVGRLIEIDNSSAAGRAVVTGFTQYIPDADADPEFRVVASGAWGRSYLGVPLSRDGKAEGALTLIAERSHAFTPRHIELVQTFADQAVIAVENARLFEQVQARTREVEQSLSDLRKAQDRLVQSEKLASLGQLTAGIAHEIKNPLNFVNNFSALSRELMEELRETLQRLPDDARADADDLMGMIDSNLEKVAHHGKRADSIVKNMLLHSREGSGERTSVNVNAMVEEALNLGYHGARAEKPGFNVTLEKSFDPQAGEADLYLQEVTRVLLNLISNGFYATDKRRQAEGPSYEPTLTASTRDLGHNVEIRIRDNGAGIPDEVRAKMFNPFFTTKPAGEGTGLGLSLSHDIVVKQHGGTIDVETTPGAFTEFILTLPRAGTGA